MNDAKKPHGSDIRTAFNVDLSRPYDPEVDTYQGRKNESATVVAATAARAIEVVLAHWPGGEVHAVHRNGRRWLLIDDEPAAAAPGEG